MARGKEEIKLKDYRDAYYWASGKASDIAGQLAFAGIALIWAFKTENAEGAHILGQELLTSGAIIVLALAFDLMQYVSGTLVWGWFSRLKEREGVKPTVSLAVPRYFNWPGLAIFWPKDHSRHRSLC